MFEVVEDDGATGVAPVTLWVRLMPEFAVLIRGVDQSPPVREQRLIACLAVLRRRVPRATLAHLLWPDVVHVRALASLRSTLRELRRHPAGMVIDDNRLTLALHPAADVDWIEATETAGFLAATSDGPHIHVSDETLVPTASAAIVMLSYPLLPAWDEPWLRADQEAFEQLRAQALEALSRHLFDRGAHALAARAALASLAAVPLRESAYAALIDAQIGEGNRAAAVTTFRTLARLLRDELGVEPSFRFRGV